MEGVSPEPQHPVSSTEATLLASRALLGVVATSLAPALDEVSLPVFRLLVLLTANGPRTPEQLQASSAATPTVAQRTLDEAAEEGWVSLASTGVVHLEPRGRALVDEVTERRRSQVATILGSMDAAQQQRLTDAFTEFAAAAGEAPMESLLSLGL
jgi:DNA-binding MarR family transcriptional regulator